jgi:hypothetical protein
MPGLFLPFEARPLSRVPIPTVPYMKELIKERQAMYRKAIEMKVGITKWESQIKELYKVNRWFKLNKVGKIIADPWRMFRDFGDKYRARKPEYDSPWEKRQRDFRDYQGKVERTLLRLQGKEAQ